MNVGAFMIYLLTPYYLVHVLGAETATAGLFLAVSPLGMIVAAPVAGHLLRLAGSFRLGIAASPCSGRPCARSPPCRSRPGWAALAAVLFAHGCGQGLFQVANLDFVMGSIPRSRQGVAGSLTW